MITASTLIRPITAGGIDPPADKLKKFVSEKGKILPRRVTGLCAKHQREVTLAIKRARHIGLLPYTAE